MASKKQKITSHQLVQGTPEWREARSKLITGSRIAAVMGVSPFQTRQSLLNEMAKESVGIFDDATNVAMEWGNENESTAKDAAEYLLSTEFEVPGMVSNSLYPQLGYSPDGVHWDNRLLLELKCPYGIRKDNPPTFKGIDELQHYWHQCQMGMLVCDLDEAWLVQWTPNGLQEIHILRDPDYWKTIGPEVKSFMKELKELTSDDEFMEGLSVRDDRPWLLASEDYKLAKALVDHANEALDKAKASLLDLAPRGGHGNGVKVSTVHTKGRVNYTKAIKELCPDADLTPYTGAGTTSLRITISKE